jgi:hypothetical protein
MILEKFYSLTKRAKGTKLNTNCRVLLDYITTLNSLITYVKEKRDDLVIRANNEIVSTPRVKHLCTCILTC